EGVPPFIRLGPLPTMVAIVNDEPRGPVRAGPLAPALMALLTKDPQTRPDAARAAELFREALTPSRTEPDGRDAVALTAPLALAARPVRTPPPEAPLPRPKVSASPPVRARPSPERVVEPVAAPGPGPGP